MANRGVAWVALDDSIGVELGWDTERVERSLLRSGERLGVGGR